MTNNIEEQIENTWTYIEEEDCIETEQKYHKRYIDQSIKRNFVTDLFKRSKNYTTVRNELDEHLEKFRNLTGNNKIKNETIKLIKENQEERPTEEEGTIIATNKINRINQINSIYDTDGKILSICIHDDYDPYLIFFKLIHNSCGLEACDIFYEEYKKLSSSVQILNNKISKIFWVKDKTDDIKHYVNEILKSYYTFTESINNIDEISNIIDSNNVLQTAIASLFIICLSEIDYETNDREKQEILSKYDNITESHSCYIFKEYLFERDPYYTLIQKMWMNRDMKMQNYFDLSYNLKTIDGLDSETRDEYIQKMKNENSNAYNRLTGGKNTELIEDKSLALIIDKELQSEEEEEDKKTDIMEYAQPILFAASLIFTYVNRKTIGSVIETSGSNVYAVGLTTCEAVANKITVPVNEYGQSFVESIKNVNYCGQSSSTTGSNVLHLHQ
tara:strand:+ start:266 stop:1600 length:1335 start_codon:yes stop_codon:yes gene_type:complete